MKNSKGLLIVLIASCFCFAACGQKKVIEDSDTEQAKRAPIESGSISDSELESEVKIKIYDINENADGFDVEEVIILSLTQENIVEELKKKNILSPEIEVASCTLSEYEGAKVIDLEFSNSFNEYIRSQGSTGEYYILGSICNTFLNAFSCDKIKIKVNKETLMTGHAEYSSYMPKFQ